MGRDLPPIIGPLDRSRPEGLTPHHYPVKRTSLGPRQRPLEPRQALAATSGGPKADLPAGAATAGRETGNAGVA